MAQTDCFTFGGEWSDSLGNTVRVLESAQGIEVSLSKPNGEGKEIQLAIKKVSPTSYQCGHYIMDEKESSAEQIVWRDKRWSNRITVWDRTPKVPASFSATEGLHTQQPATCSTQCTIQAQGELGLGSTSIFSGQTPAGAPLPSGKRMWESPHPQLLGKGPWGGTEAQTEVPHDFFLEQSHHHLRHCRHHHPHHHHHQAAQSGTMRHALVNQSAMKDSVSKQGPVIRPPSAYLPGNPPATSILTASAAHTAPPVPQMASSMPPLAPGNYPHEVKEASVAVSMAVGTPQSVLGLAEVTDDSDWSHVLGVLAAAGQDPASSNEVKVSSSSVDASLGNSTDACTKSVPHDSQVEAPTFAETCGSANNFEEARWSEVLDVLAATSAPSGSSAACTLDINRSEVDSLFSPFNLARPAPAKLCQQEQVREQVLEETLSRLLREKHSKDPLKKQKIAPYCRSDNASNVTKQTWRPNPTLTDLTEQPDNEVPDWVRNTAVRRGMVPAPRKPIHVEAPLDKFIRVFGLDELAATCLRRLEDDEAACIIESCQGRLKHARNPSAVVMIAIKGVAARVGRRYWGDREADELTSSCSVDGLGTTALVEKRTAEEPLKVFAESPDQSLEEPKQPQAATDPYLEVVDLDDNTNEIINLEQQVPANPRGKASEEMTLEVIDDIDEVEPVSATKKRKLTGLAEDCGIFFVDTQGCE